MKDLSKVSQYNYFETKPTIGFFPFFSSLGDTFPLVQIAKKCIKMGGKAVFFSHGGKYEKLASDIGCKIIKVDPYYSQASMNKITKNLYYGKDLSKSVEEEIKAYVETGIKLLVTSFNLSSNISARAVKLPLVFVFSGTLSPTYFKSKYATFPEEYEFYITRWIPQRIKEKIFNWYMLGSKSFVRKYNKIAKKYKIQPFKRHLDLILGDYFLVCDDIEFLGLKSTIEVPAENYIGPILSDDLFQKQTKQLNHEIEQHLKRPGKSILLSMGSSGNKELFLKILKILSKTEYNIIAIYTTILNEKELPKLNDNILLKKFVPSIKNVNEMVDLAILHGGRGTVYTAAYSAKPVIGIPMQFEQQFNLDCLVRHGSTIRLSRKFFHEKNLIDAIDQILNNYDFYMKNAQDLAKKLLKPEGDRNAAKRIFEILDVCHKRKNPNII